MRNKFYLNLYEKPMYALTCTCMHFVTHGHTECMSICVHACRCMSGTMHFACTSHAPRMHSSCTSKCTKRDKSPTVYISFFKGFQSRKPFILASTAHNKMAIKICFMWSNDLYLIRFFGGFIPTITSVKIKVCCWVFD